MRTHVSKARTSRGGRRRFWCAVGAGVVLVLVIQAGSASRLMTSVAHAAEPDGAYRIDTGKLSIKLQIPSVLAGKASVPNFRKVIEKTGLNGQMVFMPAGQEDNLVIEFPPLPVIGSFSLTGTWTLPPGSSKFTADVIKDEDVQETVALLNQLSGRQDVTAQLTKNSFTGKVLANGKVKCAFSSEILLSLPPVSLTLSLSGNLAGSEVTPDQGGLAIQSLGAFVADLVKELRPRP